MALTNVAIKSAKPGAKPLKLAHSEGLLLHIQPSGARYWLGRMACSFPEPSHHSNGFKKRPLISWKGTRQLRIKCFEPDS